MRVLLINNGGGYCDHVEVKDGTTVAQLFDEHIKSGKPSDYLIRVNRLPVPSEQVLQPGDRVSINPTKIEGARS
ncbi:MAG TPA: MoaD/ThiS family protein [Pirellulales bacterium]|jgi:sulfur carrier protein ThiS|nr:MoaD/ThiS family protein [Pirellulales bacterium]